MKKIIFIIIIFFIIFLIFSFIFNKNIDDVSDLNNIEYKKKKFSLLEWEKKPNKRYEMVYDLLLNHKKELLTSGEPDYFESIEPYETGYTIGKIGIIRRCNIVLYIKIEDRIELECPTKFVWE